MPKSLKQKSEVILATIEMIHDQIMKRLIEANQSGSDICGSLSVTLPQLRALEVIGRSKDCNNKQLAEALHVTQASASAMVERLVDLDLIERQIPVENRRTVKLALSARGTDIALYYQNVLATFVGEMLQNLGADLSDQWLDVCLHLQQILMDAKTPTGKTAEHIKKD